jgi:hypothetical protein
MIPPFGSDGLLPPGIHGATWSEIVEAFGFNAYRLELLTGLARALDVLRIAGCSTVYLDGSFVTAEPFPNDFDGCWVRDDVNADMLDAELLDCSPRGRAAQKGRYGGELFPIHSRRIRAAKSLLTFFQTDRNTGMAKGIIAIELRTLP